MKASRIVRLSLLFFLHFTKSAPVNGIEKPAIELEIEATVFFNKVVCERLLPADNSSPMHPLQHHHKGQLGARRQNSSERFLGVVSKSGEAANQL